MEKSWSKSIETVGLISVIAGLVLVAYEIRQANNIAKAQVVMDLSFGANEINSARFSNGDFAKLFLLMESPETQIIEGEDVSRMKGLAYHIHNVLWSAQTAYNSGLLSLTDLENHRNDCSVTLEEWPGLRSLMIEIYETHPGKKDAFVFEPLAKLAAEDPAL